MSTDQFVSPPPPKDGQEAFRRVLDGPSYVLHGTRAVFIPLYKSTPIDPPADRIWINVTAIEAIDPREGVIVCKGGRVLFFQLGVNPFDSHTIDPLEVAGDDHDPGQVAADGLAVKDKSRNLVAPDGEYYLVHAGGSVTRILGYTTGGPAPEGN